MYSYIIGKIKQIKDHHLIIENNGIGYSINTSSNSINSVVMNEETTLYTSLYVREDILSLFGFSSVLELELFEILIKISGVGPKAALSILSLADVNTLKYSIFNGDSKFIAQASGIGKKTAEKIIIELKDKIKDDFIGTESTSFVHREDSKLDFVTEALAALGFNPNEARMILKGIDTANLSEDELIKLALKKIGS
ncbi:MAG: Holliday junction branch migration protein RuvA [Tissierellales bacterium]|jgi:holliday junction DNA helicase RuvA|nr:Holliday junction branch migration protein RuvA [Tissierellales bacterium]MBN2827892.1 Holliday junction branch migration protein RuvA [Tissierellales bacterium]